MGLGDEMRQVIRSKKDDLKDFEASIQLKLNRTMENEVWCPQVEALKGLLERPPNFTSSEPLAFVEMEEREVECEQNRNEEGEREKMCRKQRSLL